jgi:hypothetical protein
MLIFNTKYIVFKVNIICFVSGLKDETAVDMVICPYSNAIIIDADTIQEERLINSPELMK